MQGTWDDIHEDVPAAHGNANRIPKQWSCGKPCAALGTNSEQLGPHSRPEEPPLVSIVLPVHNGEAFLRECLQSIVMQSHRPLELAVCDNGSTDSTPQILATWRPKLEEAGVQYVCVTTGAADPRGCGYGRNRCIEAASGAVPPPLLMYMHRAGTQGYNFQSLTTGLFFNHRALFLRECTPYTGMTECVIPFIASPIHAALLAGMDVCLCSKLLSCWSPCIEGTACNGQPCTAVSLSIMHACE